MVDIIGINFDSGKKVYYFDPNNLKLEIGQNVIVETERGLQYGHVVTGVISKSKDALNSPLRKVVRIATKEDDKKNSKNISDAKKAILECEKLIKNII